MGALIALEPMAELESRLEAVQRSGRGLRARCPACGGKSRKLAVDEADNGSVLLHCFGGCSALAVVQAAGLSLADLFPTRLTPMTDAERREAKRRFKEAGWRAALDMLDVEGAVVQIAQQELSNWQVLSEEDDKRLSVAKKRIAEARAVLRG